MFTRRIGIAVCVVLVLAGLVIWAATSMRDATPSPITDEGIDLRKTTEGPLEITVSDSGKAFSYPIGSRFTVILDSTLYPENALSCAPPSSGVVRQVETQKEVKPPLYARTFEVTGSGACTMTNTRFIAAIVVAVNIQ